MKTTITENLHAKIGIVSGIGPLAGSDVFAKVLQHAAQTHGAVEDCDYPNLLLINQGISGVDNLGTLNNNFECELIEVVQQLELQGATIIGIACNTAHAYLEKIKVNQTTILINLIDQVALEASKAAHHYLLLTSSTSRLHKLYHPYLEKYGVSFSQATPEQQAVLDEVVTLVMAYKLSQAGALLEEVLQEANTSGFSAVIAGCTELPIAIKHCTKLSNMHIVDSNWVLACSLVGKYYQMVSR